MFIFVIQIVYDSGDAKTGGKGNSMINIVFCISEGNHKRYEDEFSLKNKTHIFRYDDSKILLKQFLSYLSLNSAKVIETKLELKHRGERMLIDLNRICYIEITKRIVEVHVIDEETPSYLAYAKISDLEECLEGLGFIRVHKSFLVSIHYIENFSSTEITMRMGKVIHVGRVFKHNVKDIRCAACSKQYE